MEKQELMRELLDIYAQRDSITVPCSQMIMDQYIKKLEMKLYLLLGKQNGIDK